MASIQIEKANLLSYTLQAVDSRGNILDLTPITKKISWNGSLQGAAMKLNVDLMAYPGLGDLVTYGDMLMLKGIDAETGALREVLRGYVFDRNRQSGRDGMTLTVYGMLIYLLKNKGDYIFSDTKASTVVSTICNDYDLPVGSIADTGYRIPKMIERGSTLYDIMIKALVLTRDGYGTKFLLRSTGGKINLIPKPNNPVSWVLAGGVNIQKANLTESIEDMKNRVVVRSHANDNQASAVLAVSDDQDLINQFGILQEITTVDENAKTKPDAKAVANNLLKKLGKVTKTGSITAIGVNDLYPGDPVIVEEPTTGLRGTYYVKEITVTVEGGNSTMDVSLAWDDDLQADTTDTGVTA